MNHSVGEKGRMFLTLMREREGKECGECYMSCRHWSLCRDLQVRKTDNGSSPQRSQLDWVTDLGERLIRHVTLGKFSQLPAETQIHGAAMC